MAIICAAFVHVVLLTIKGSLDVPRPKSQQELRVTLVAEQKANDKPVEKTIVNQPPALKPTVSEPRQPSQIKPSQPKIIVATPSATQPVEPRLAVDVSPNSDLFRRFLRSETDRHREANPESVSEFEQSFKPQERANQEVTSSSKEAQTQILRTGVGFAVDKNGKRTCLGRMPNLYSELGAPSILGQDCTPPKKFILDLDKPINN